MTSMMDIARRYVQVKAERDRLQSKISFMLALSSGCVEFLLNTMLLLQSLFLG
jgi:hypothetical protein